MKRSILGLIYLIQGMRDAGLPVEQRLAEIGIHVDSLDPQAKIYIETEMHIQDYIAQNIEPEKGLQIGQYYALSGYGPLLMCLMTAATVKDAILNGLKFQALTYLMGRLQFQEKAHKAGLIYIPKDIHVGIGQFRAQAEISGTYKFLRDMYLMTGLNVTNLEVYLPFTKPKNKDTLAAYYQYYGNNLHFEANQAEFWCDLDLLKVKLSSADPVTHQVFAQQCENEIQYLSGTFDANTNLANQISDYLTLQHLHIPSMKEVAQVFDLPERTLRHQLEQAQITFKEIRENVLKNRALKMLADDCSIETIAEALGYSESAAFNHAFKRWYSCSPRQYKQQ